MAIVTISRGSYTKGKEIAERVAENLGYECLSRDILLEASEQFNIPEIRLVRALHDAPSVLERFGHGRERYVAFIENAFLEHVRRDNVVYHGLAGHFFLRGVAHGFKVRVIADLDERVRLEMERAEIDERTARETLKKDDFERRRWALALYGVDTVDPILYDMVLNVGNMTLDCAVEMISGAARSPCFATTEASQAKLENLLLASRVRVAVVDLCPEVRVSAVDRTAFVDVEAAPGEEIELRRKVQSLAAAVEGVEKVRVNVRPQGPP
jgi:cytidylate kinase